MSFYLKKRKKILKKILVGFSLFISGALAFTAVSYLSKRYFPADWLSHSLFPVLLMTCLCIVAYKPLDRLFAALFERYFFKKKNYAHIVLMNLAQELELLLDIGELSNLIVNTFGEVLHLKKVALITQDNEKKDFEIVAAYGWNISEYKKVKLTNNSSIMRFIRASGPHVLVRNRVIRTFSWQEANDLIHDFDILRASWVIPLFAKDSLTGILAFSAEESERVFGEADFHFFREFARRIAKSLHNGLVYRELKLANEALKDAQSKMIQTTKFSAIEQLASGIAHEIHNPLTIISGKAQVLLLQSDKNPLDDRVEDVLKTIVKQTKRAADITRKLLMFSQDSGTPKEDLRLEQVLDDTLALVSYQMSLDGIQLKKTIVGEIPRFYANVHEMREIFLNLVLNAVQSIGPEGRIEIKLSANHADRFVELQVADNGKGIERENIEKVFNPFYTTRQSALGLGLFVTKQIVHHYGGGIRADSHPDEGSLFSVKLPFQEGPETHDVIREIANLPEA